MRYINLHLTFDTWQVVHWLSIGAEFNDQWPQLSDFEWPWMPKQEALWMFWLFLAATQVCIIHKVAPRNYRYAIQIENLVFVY